MNDNKSYPDCFEIELAIDQDRLRRYQLMKFNKAMAAISSVVVFALTSLFLAAVHDTAVDDFMATLVLCFPLWSKFICVALLVLLAIYLWCRRWISTYPATHRLRVDGDQLVCESERKGTVAVRRTHFRAISDFVAQQEGVGKQLEIATLVVNTSSEGYLASYRLAGLTDVHRVCKTLAELKAQRS